jgi:outer membrane protein OmpA-like peptidoglycan-associated protein
LEKFSETGPEKTAGLIPVFNFEGNKNPGGFQMKGYFLMVFLGLAVVLNGCASTGKMAKTQSEMPTNLGPQIQDFNAFGDVSQTVKGIKLTLASDLLFKVAHSHLSKEGTQKIDAVAAVLLKHPTYQAKIAAYTDNSGSDKGNLRISKRRAKAVQDELVKQGISASNLTASGMGSAEPVAANDTPDNQAKNRRVEMDIFAP